MASEFDVISAEVQVKNLQPTIMEIKNGIEQAELFLKVLMGVDIKQTIEVEGNLLDYGNSISSSNAERNLSIDANTDLRQLGIQQQQLERALSMQRTQRMPMLAAFGSYGYSGTGNRSTIINFSGMQIPVEKETNWFSQGLIAGLQLNIPLSGILTNIPKEKQTKIQIGQLAEQRDYLEDMLNMQVRTALNSMDKAAKQAEVARKNEELAQRGYDIALKRYEAGMGIMLEVQNASNQLMQAQLSHNQAIASYLNTKSDLEKLLGNNE
jgi:outer membrane protein TolC